MSCLAALSGALAFWMGLLCALAGDFTSAEYAFTVMAALVGGIAYSEMCRTSDSELGS